MLRRLLVVSALTLVASWLWYITPLSAQGQSAIGYRDVSPQELQDLLAGDHPFVLDVHVPNEGHLAATDARIPYTEVADRASELPTDLDALIVVYCMSGRMSEIAATQLVGLGYRNVLNLAGGMIAWKAAGYELISE
jgi:rhodanese-related sulfurtransferase